MCLSSCTVKCGLYFDILVVTSHYGVVALYGYGC